MAGEFRRPPPEGLSALQVQEIMRFADAIQRGAATFCVYNPKERPGKVSLMSTAPTMLVGGKNYVISLGMTPELARTLAAHLLEAAATAEGSAPQ